MSAQTNDNNVKLDLLARERAELRSEIVWLEGRLMQIAFVFLTLAAATAGVYVKWGGTNQTKHEGKNADVQLHREERAFSKQELQRTGVSQPVLTSVSSQPVEQERLTIGASTEGVGNLGVLITFTLWQAQYLLGVIAVLLLGSMAVHSGYLMAIEEKINGLADVPIACWETEMVPHHLFSRTSVVGLSSVWLVILIVASHVYLVYQTIRMSNPGPIRVVFIIVFVIEIIPIAILLSRTISEGSRAHKSAQDRFIAKGKEQPQ